ncbi:probable leucine--tRNA ligase, mitochondrial [Chelonus insularis]|uniref:probable leucine--tRNA ligase, mitochondrial n=1 Tax=Chelonus insularis TaxID=460826 RepID=UPI00158C0494|nr:probable leucine--tRNA ligase, mitochondrial [Chelonus insularis]
MKYITFNYSKSTLLIWNCRIFQHIIRHASSGLGLWDLNIDNDIRLKIEDYWKDKIFMKRVEDNSTNNENKYYVLSMFPYPSGSLHMGHVRVYAISDAVSRFHRMHGKNVIHPMGWDAFGLPAENAALERNIDPHEWTAKNISNMKNQLHLMGCDFDWDRELTTCDPSYYRWTQELFLKLYDRRLAYQKEAFVNWDPIDKTVLADEQVDQNGKSWRSHAKVEKKLFKQWFIKTTAFAKSLLDGLNDPLLQEWRDVIKIQKHWIGECNGISIEFQLISDLPEKPQTLNLWTDRPELIEHAKFVAVSKSNFLATSKIKDFNEISSQYLNAQVINPFNNKKLPIYYINSIEFSRLRDNYLGIPCISESDAEFCKSNNIHFDYVDYINDEKKMNKKRFQVMKEAQMKGIGGFPVSSTLKDWLISRQRYWGTPIPIIHCENCGTIPVPRDQLPVLLPKQINCNSKIPNLREALEWLKTSCPKCNSEAVREADTMDTFVDSSWYFMRYIDSNNTKEMFSKKKAAKYLPVDLYIGGKEHAALHLYYARFINHFLHSEGLLPTREPFIQLLVQGMVMGKSFRVKSSGKYLKLNEIEQCGTNFVEKKTNNPVVVAWEKMSKSKYNGTDPINMFNEYGSDTTRLIMLADFAPTSPRNWTDETFQGIFNWQQRLWLSIRHFIKNRQKVLENEPEKINDLESIKKDDLYLYDSRNYYIKGVTFNMIGSQQLSVAISKMQGLTNSLRKISLRCLISSPEFERTLATQIIMLAPIAPRFASELWSGFCSAPYFLIDNDPFMNREKDVLEQRWPEVDMNYKLNLHIRIGTQEVDKIKVSRYILEQISVKEATDFAHKSDKFRNIIKKHKIIDVQFLSKPGGDAIIQFKSEKLPSPNLKNEESI